MCIHLKPAEFASEVLKASLGVKQTDVVHQSGTALRVAMWELLLFLLKAVDFFISHRPLLNSNNAMHLCMEVVRKQVQCISAIASRLVLAFFLFFQLPLCLNARLSLLQMHAIHRCCQTA